MNGSCKWGTYWSSGGPAKRIFHLNVPPAVTNSQSPGGDPFEKSDDQSVCVSVCVCAYGNPLKNRFDLFALKKTYAILLNTKLHLKPCGVVMQP